MSQHDYINTTVKYARIALLLVVLLSGLLHAQAPIWLSVSPDQIVAGERFWVNVHIGDDATEIENLFGISLKLQFSHQQFLTVDTTITVQDMRGDILQHPDTTLFFLIPRPTDGFVAVAHTRKFPAPGVTGTGVIARIPFLASRYLPDSTRLQFNFRDVRAEDPETNRIPVQERSSEFIATQPEFFWIEVNPDSAEINKGESATFEVELFSLGGFSNAVNLSLSPQIEGLQASFSPQTIRPGESASLQIDTEDALFPGVYPLVVHATYDTLANTDTLVLAVSTIPIFPVTENDQVYSTEPFAIDIRIGNEDKHVVNLAELNFDLQIAGARWLTPFDLSQFVLSDTLTENFSIERKELVADDVVHIEIKLKEGNWPFTGFGRVFTFNFNSLLATPNNTNLRFNLADISARDANDRAILLSTKVLHMTIVERNAFTFSLDPESGQITAGEAISFRAIVKANPSFDDSITLDVLNLPVQATADYSSKNLQGSGEALITLASDSAIAPGIYTIPIAATSSDQQFELPFTLDILPFHDYTLLLDPEHAEISSGDSVTFTISTLIDEPFDESIQLSIAGLDDLNYLTYSLLPDAIHWDEMATLSVYTQPEMQPGMIRFELSGFTPTIRRFANGEINILEPPPPVRPNPFTPNEDGFNDLAIFDFPEISASGGAVVIFDIKGRKIRELRSNFVWDGRDKDGKKVLPGAYLYVVKTARETKAQGVIGLAR